MAPDPDPDSTDGPSPTRPPNWGLAVDLGVRMAVSVGIGLGGGLLLDNWLRTVPVFTLIGMVLGIGAAMATIWTVARDSMRR